MCEYLNFFSLSISAYDFFNVMGFFILLGFNYCMYSREVKLYSVLYEKAGKKYLKLCAITAVFALSCVQFFTGVGMNKFLGNLITGGSDNYFGFAVLAPIIFVVFCTVLGFDPLNHLDLFTPAYALSLVSFKIACFCAGCCGGVYWELGPYYPSNGETEFPVQISEAIVALSIFFILMFYRKKSTIGTMHPLYLILYSSTRFFTEFLRHEPNILGPFKFYHVQCLIGTVIGTLEFIYMKYHGEVLNNSLMAWARKYIYHVKTDEPDPENKII